MVIFTRTLEIAGTSGFVQPIKLVQYDATLPVGVFELVENGQPFDIPAGTKAKVRLRKADGKGVYNDATVSGDTVQVVFTQQMTAAFGVGFLNIELIYDGGVKSSEPVQVVVLENAVQQGAIESADEFLTLDEIVKQVETLRQQTATDAASAAASKTAAASSATAAQAARQGAEAAESRVNAIVAGNESYTKRQSRDMFALALKATAEKAANLEIYPDEGSNVAVTSYGFTEQAGTGDPGPTNVRQITVGGKKLVEVVLTGSEIWKVSGTGSGQTPLFYSSNLVAGIAQASTFYSMYALCNSYKKTYITGSNSSVGFWTYKTDVYIRDSVYKQNVDEFKSMLSARYAAGTPVKVWYQPADESQATGIYTPIESTGAEYSCVCVPLTDYLCDGDTVEACVKSGCDKRIVLDGTETLSDISNRGNVTRAKINGKPLAPSGFTTVFCNKLNRLDSWTSNTAHCYVEVYPYIFIENSKLTSTDALGVQKHLASAYEEGEPYILWYRSTEYTAENDIPVCLETHLQSLRVLNGVDESWTKASDAGAYYSSFKGKPSGKVVSEYLPYATPEQTKGGKTGIGTGELGGVQLRLPNGENPDEYLPKNPLTIVYELATPITYSHDPVYLEAYPDGNGKFTVSGEKLVSARYNKSLSKAFEDLQSAVLAMGANLSS